MMITIYCSWQLCKKELFKVGHILGDDNTFFCTEEHKQQYLSDKESQDRWDRERREELK